VDGLREENFRALDAINVAHVVPPFLRRSQLEVRLHHPAQHLAPVRFEHALDLVQRRLHRCLVAQRVFRTVTPPPDATR
jgi:hypothetical protein